MKTLLENDFPKHYNVGKRPKAVECTTRLSEFDLKDQDDNFVFPVSWGDASFINTHEMELSIIKYDNFLNLFGDTNIAIGKKRCDFIMTDVNSQKLCLLCEITSAMDSYSTLSKPIYHRIDKTICYSNGKYEKAELQLYETLSNIFPVNSIKDYISLKKRKVCLMSYYLNLSTHSAQNSFNKARETEANEAGENGAQVPSDRIESMGFSYFRISHNYRFKL